MKGLPGNTNIEVTDSQCDNLVSPTKLQRMRINISFPKSFLAHVSGFDVYNYYYYFFSTLSKLKCVSQSFLEILSRKHGFCLVLGFA